jgi:hypothetical protein
MAAEYVAIYATDTFYNIAVNQSDVAIPNK